MASGHGGARAGAGRKPKAEKYGAKMDAGDKFVADRLLKFYRNLEKLADGGSERVREVWKPAGLVLIDDVVRDADGLIITDERGKPTKTHSSAFPLLSSETLVLVERRVEIAEADRAANEYLIDRLQGKPTASVEAEITTDMGGALIEAFGGALTKIYGTDLNGDGTDLNGECEVVCEGGDTAAAEGG